MVCNSKLTVPSEDFQTEYFKYKSEDCVLK